MRSRPPQGAVVTRHGHGEEAHGDGAGFCCLGGGGLAGRSVGEVHRSGSGNESGRGGGDVHFFAMGVWVWGRDDWGSTGSGRTECGGRFCRGSWWCFL